MVRLTRCGLRSYLPWLGVYVLLITTACTGLSVLRSRVVRVMSSPEEGQHWQHWREAADKSAQQVGVQRRVPRSAEPPALVLMRDYFGVVIAAAIVFGSVFYLIGMLLIRGVWSSRRPDRARIPVAHPIPGAE